jgi:hypothetical protein
MALIPGGFEEATITSGAHDRVYIKVSPAHGTSQDGLTAPLYWAEP